MPPHRDATPGLLEAAYATAPIGLGLVDTDLRFVMVNEHLAAIHGLPAQAHIGQRIGHVLGKPGAALEPILRRVLDTGEPMIDMEFAASWPPGKPCHCWLLSYQPMFDHDGKVVGVNAVVREAPPFRQGLRLVLESVERQHQMDLLRFIDSAPVAIAMFDREMRYMAVSRRFMDELRMKAEGIIGRSHYDVFPDVPERWRAIHRRCLAGETLSSEEDPFLRSDGMVDWVRWAINPWHTASGEVGGILLFSENITKRKQAEAALVVAKAEAERANDAKSRFLAAASHDLRQPLQALNLYQSALKTRLPPSEAPILRHMESCLASLSELLTDLLDLSKLDAGVVMPKLSTFPVSRILDKVASTHIPAAEARHLRLRVVGSTLSAHTDPVLFERMVGNLVTNAIRYTQRGGVVVGCRNRGGTAWIEVCDSGIGIPADKTDEIFEEFRQLSNEERSREKGSGLGLAIVAKTARLLNLKVRVTSLPGRGSVFAIELPMSG